MFYEGLKMHEVERVKGHKFQSLREGLNFKPLIFNAVACKRSLV